MKSNSSPSLFVDFPNNTVWYQQVIKRTGITEDVDKQEAIRYALSRNIMTAFAETVIDNEQLLIYSIYILFATVTTWFSNTAQARAVVQGLLMGSVSDDKPEVWENIYLQNRQTFFEIYEQCSSTAEEWIEQWRSFIMAQARQMPFESFFPVLVDLLYEHVGINLNANNLQGVLVILDKILNRAGEPTAL